MAGYGLNAKLIDFLHSCPPVTLKKLVEWGIVDRKFVVCNKTIGEYLDDWRQELVARNNSAAHVKNFYSKVSRLIRHCKWQALSDINIEDAKKWLLHREKNEKVSTETRNHDIQAIKGFCNWLADKGCITSPHPLQPIKTKSAKGDRRRVRRPFVHDDFIRLLEYTAVGEKHHGLIGTVRALCYKLAVRTGMRHSEVRSLVPESFNMDIDLPTVFLKGKDAKNKKDQLFIIASELVEELREHLKTIQPGKRVFNMHRGRGAAMLARDLRAAGITVLDSFGRTLDFHALRHTYSVDLGLAGVNPLIRQKIMRHSSAAVMERYSEVDLEHHAEALSKLPSLIPAKKQVDRPVDRRKVNNTGLNGTFEGKNEDDTEAEKNGGDEYYFLSSKGIAEKNGQEEMEAAARIELAYDGFANHCLTAWLRRLVEGLDFLV